MENQNQSDDRVDEWLAALEQRHLADLTPTEVARALRALSSCYVERRAKLADGGALGTAGKRAAFALFYAPIHFLIVRHIVRSLVLNKDEVVRVLDLGCGTGSAGAAWAIECEATVSGIDRHPWVVAEANWTYRQLGLRGRAVHADIARARLDHAHGAGIVAAYAMNELPDPVRSEMLGRLIEASGRGAQVLIVEPIARRLTPWWTSWAEAFSAAHGRADEWRFAAMLPPRQRLLAKAAGLNPAELTARSLWLRGRR